MSKEKHEKNRALEHFRFAIVGPLLASPPDPGQLQTQLRELAKKHWRHPANPHQTVQYSVSTLERWYYAALKAKEPVKSLARKRRNDAGQSRKLSSTLINVLQEQYYLYRHWSVQLHYDNLKAKAKLDPSLQPLPSYSTIRRLMKTKGWHKQARKQRNTLGQIKAQDKLDQREVRSFEVQYVNGLWHLDFHHGSIKVLTQSGQWVVPKLLGIIDDRSRLICHAQWYLDETVESLVHGFSQALQKRDLPRALMTDNGAAMVAEEFTQGLHDLSILWEPTLPYSPYQNAKQETFWATLEGRLMAMLSDVPSLSLRELNEWTQIWVERDYHQTIHREIGMTPLSCFINTNNVARACPSSVDIKNAFRRIDKRKQRRSDGTVSLMGKRFEIPSAYKHLDWIHIRYASWDLSSLDMVDPDSLMGVSPLLPLDKARNAHGLRKQLATMSVTAPSKPTGSIPPLLAQLRQEQFDSGMPTAFLSKDDLS